ncbi:cobyric acid synthase CobQ [Aquirufa ecclesiirivi]|uniref:cobyric acid synthase CobQ n=1 Tax=Aquirufa ecclesiirivi TaxID=2715124 RepID=UPI0023D830EB|nr:cobyric acid synthase CobQ [Aquirufa ecclesiirivi]MDF0694786.1 cobyric acid synthase CobQ [Aquirufa ecclesiirivi]
MANASIKYYPVGNGDTSLITLEDKTTIVVDCNIRNCDIDEIYDVKKDLLQCLQYSNGIPYVDVFILTHGDQDHCRGFKNHFYQGAPEKYSEADKKEKRIRVDTMWFSPMIAEEHTNDDEDAYQQEAERRLTLHRNKDPKKDNPGNRINIIGYDGSTDYKDLDHLRAKPGDTVERFNDRKQVLFSIFIHAPFKEHLEALGDDKKNSTSIVFQARFKNTPYQQDFSTLAMFGGDSDHTSWCIILEKTKKYRNEHALKWDLFLSPHHCSWSFFNDRPQEENPDPKKTSLEVLDYKRINAKVIASSKKILNDEDNPPHFEAKREYVKKVTEGNFLNTTTYNVVNKTPQPITFEVTSQGIVKPKQTEGAAKVAGGAGLGIVNIPSKYGNGKV